MAIPYSPATSGRPTLLDAWGYGHDPQRATPWSAWLVSAAVVFYFGMLPLLWRHAVWLLPSIVWTSISTCLIWSAVIMARQSSVSLRPVSGCILLFCLAYPFFGWISYLLLGEVNSARQDLLFYTMLIMQLALSLYFLGAASRSHRAYPAIWIAWGITAAYALANIHQLNMQSLYESVLETGLVLNYQLMGDAFAICTAILATRIQRTYQRWLFAAFSIAVMFIIPSRSAAFFGACALFTALVLMGSRGERAMLVSVAIALVLGQQTGVFASLFEGSRFESFFTPNSHDNSWDSRQEVNDLGFAVLAEKPFTGSWAFQVDELNEAGAYMHNALDIWAQTGIIPFLLFLACWGAMLMALMAAYRRWPGLAREAIPVLVFAALSWILSRNVTNAALFFCLGYASATLAQARFGVPRR